MTRRCMGAAAGLLMVALVVCGLGPAASAAPQQPPQERKTDYSPAEYNAYIAATKETNPQQRIRLLDDFVAKYPNVSLQLLIPAYRVYYTSYYNDLKNYRKAIEYIDKMLTYGDKVEIGARLEALYLRAVSFQAVFGERDPTAREQATRARDAALEGLKVISQLPKPENMTDEQFNQNKKAAEALFNYTAGFASLQLKDYKAAVDSFKAALAANPIDAVAYFRLGIAYLQMEPPQYMDGFWALARSVALKSPGEAQVRDYLRKQMLRYQQTGCDKLLDDQMNELLRLAATSAERPATYKIPSAADLQKAREETTNFIMDLKAGGDKAKLLWLAVCGLEFPEVGGKVIEVSSASDSVVLKLFFAPTPEEMEAGKTANLEAKVEGQPQAKRLQAGEGARFSGTLVGYDPEPFMLHWAKAKVNPEDIPSEKSQPGKKRPPAKRPAKKSGH